MEQFGRVLKLNSLKSGDVWRQVDVLIFNTGLWWHRTGIKQLARVANSFGAAQKVNEVHGGVGRRRVVVVSAVLSGWGWGSVALCWLLRREDGMEGVGATLGEGRLAEAVRVAMWDYVEDDGIILEDMDRMVAFKKALMTWAKWVESDVNSFKTKVFFRGISPAHYKGVEWNERGARNCSKEIRPLEGSTYPSGVPIEANVVKDIMSNNISSSKSVHLLDITILSQLRKDGHPSTYNGAGRMDCTHWCVAGVPDIWNQLLYAQLLQQDMEDGFDYFTPKYL
ncbi:hypothetical protein BUALT_Bualt01G0158300 [Buddleja alternifolia]|uniref:Trichome birefringence-like C-terminal domain-containing protein n=1 Tax=Buddleja alternifolia TaxID=168488 RepID=A0AAV6Y8J8_9LAMI|nr:hypothetical protein BUALT_Bualt01G0158300 [Buddleja alternifolia]